MYDIINPDNLLIPRLASTKLIIVMEITKFKITRIIYLNACITDLPLELKTKLRANTNKVEPAINLAVGSAKEVLRPR